MARKTIFVVSIIVLITIIVSSIILYFEPTTRFQVGKLAGVKSVPNIVNSNFEVSEVVTGLSSPTTMVFVDDYIIYLQKNDGKVRLVKNGILVDKPLYDFEVFNEVEAGLLGITVNYSTVYLYVSESTVDGGDPSGNHIYKFEWNGEQLVNPKLVNELPGESIIHNGGAMVTSKKGEVFAVIGDQRKNGLTQNNPNGEINDAGVIVRVGLIDGVLKPSESKYPQDHYYAIGIRNSFGLAIDPITGYLWDTENGPDYFDEINLVLPKFNSGWNKISGPAHDLQTLNLNGFDDFIYSDPEFSWEKTVAPTGISFVDTKWGKYSNSLFVGDCNNGILYTFQLNSERTGFVFSNNELKDKVLNINDSMGEIIFGTDFGCITDVEFGPDGSLYVVSFQNNGAIYKITPI